MIKIVADRDLDVQFDDGASHSLTEISIRFDDGTVLYVTASKKMEYWKPNKHRYGNPSERVWTGSVDKPRGTTDG